MFWHGGRSVALFSLLLVVNFILPSTAILPSDVVEKTELSSWRVPARRVPSQSITEISDAASNQSVVVVSNQADHDFCRDFSVLLRELPLQWIILEQDELPESIEASNILLIGAIDSSHVGTLIDSSLDIDLHSVVGEDEPYHVITGQSAWHAEGFLILAVGVDQLAMMHAAEDAVRLMRDDSPNDPVWDPWAEVSRQDFLLSMSLWMRPVGLESVPAQDLTIVPGGRSPRRLTWAQALEDAGRLFYLLEHGYCGYGTFLARGDFDAARERVMETIEGREKWSPDELAGLIHDNLSFIQDCHLMLGELNFCDHLDFWYGDVIELWKEDGKYFYVSEGSEYRVLLVEGGDPDAYVFPSFNADGAPVYRLGMLSREGQSELTVVAEGAQGQETLEVRLSLSDFYAKDRFAEERIGGIPVIRMRSFSDYYSDQLAQLVANAKSYRGEPYVILDIRGNGGGNTRWPKEWIQSFTGRTPAMKQALSEIRSVTSMVGRANLFRLLLETYPKQDHGWIQNEIDLYQSLAGQVEDREMNSFWTSPMIPDLSRIPNESTLIVVMDRQVASAGEGLISYLFKQVDNVVFVGENSLGALTFGQVSIHELPHSKLEVTVPIKLNLMLDLVDREEIGFVPDFWVPAQHALNVAVAASRNGAISSAIPIPEGMFNEIFEPEVIRSRRATVLRETLLWITLGVALNLVFFYFQRTRPVVVAMVGSLCFTAGIFLLLRDKPPGWGFVTGGSLSIIGGVIVYLRSYCIRHRSSGDDLMDTTR